MKRELIALAVVCTFLGTLAGCDKFNSTDNSKLAPRTVSAASVIPPSGAVVVKVNNVAIGLNDLNEEINAFNASLPPDSASAKITTRDAKIEYLKKEVVPRILIYENALDKGLDRNEAVRQDVEKNKREILVRKNVESIFGNITVTAKEVEEFYNASKDQFKDPDERQISMIAVGTEQEARDLLIRLLQGEDFAILARSNSKAASAKDGGNLGFVKPGKFSPQFDAVAFSETLDLNKPSSIFKTPDGYCIVKFDATRPGKQKTLAELEEGINNYLLASKRQAAIVELTDKLMREAKINYAEWEIK